MGIVFQHIGYSFFIKPSLPITLAVSASVFIVRAREYVQMPRQQKLRPKTHIPGLPESLYDLDAFSEFDYQQELEEDRQEQRIFRVKRKHVLKACDRCRVKKTKVSELRRSLEHFSFVSGS